MNAALARMTENAAILEGVDALFGAFPAHPDHADGAPAEGVTPSNAGGER